MSITFDRKHRDLSIMIDTIEIIQETSKSNGK